MEEGGKSRGQGERAERGKERETPGEATTQHSGQCAVSAVGDGRSRSAVERRKGGSRYDKGVRDERERRRVELQVVGGERKMSEGVSPEKRVGSPSPR